MTVRLYVAAEHPGTGPYVLDSQQAHYLLRVRRLRNGDRIEVFDGNGCRREAELVDAAHGRCSLRFGARLASLPESRLRIRLIQALSGADKMDWTIEKAVELGVARISPVIAERSVVRLDTDREQRKRDHWQRLIISACMQSGRDTLPLLDAVIGLDQWLADAALERSQSDRFPEAPPGRLMLTPPGQSPASRPLSQCAGDLEAGSPVRDVELLVGPESGFTNDECETAIAVGFQTASLGPRILRTETAGLAAIAALQARFGDF